MNIENIEGVNRKYFGELLLRKEAPGEVDDLKKFVGI